MSTRRLSPGHGCGLCGAKDWGYDEHLGRWVCLNCARKGVPRPSVPGFAEVFDFDAWYHSVMGDFEATAKRLGQLEQEAEPEGELQKVVKKAELKRMHREYSQLYELSSVAMYLKSVRELGISEGADFYVHIPTCNLQIRFAGHPSNSGTGSNT